jgi:hypothetical protein
MTEPIVTREMILTKAAKAFVTGDYTNPFPWGSEAYKTWKELAESDEWAKITDHEKAA